MLVNIDFQSWHLISWQQSEATFWTSLLINMDFNMDFIQ